MQISVVIPHLNQPDFLARCLDSLASGSRVPDEIIVVDNGSESQPDSIVGKMEVARLLLETEPGPGPARNLGVRSAKGNILAFIDADCLADPAWLEAIETTFAQNPDMAILGGDVRIAIDDPDNLTKLEAYESIFAYRMEEYIRTQNFTGTGNLAVRKKVFDTVGYFGGLHIAEDRDWGQRAAKLGLQTHYIPAMKVYHPARKDLDELKAKWDRSTAHDYKLKKDMRVWRLRWLLRALAIAASPVGEIPRILKSDRVTGTKNRVLAFSCLCNIRIHRAITMLRLLAGQDPEKLSGRWNRVC